MRNHCITPLHPGGWVFGKRSKAGFEIFWKFKRHGKYFSLSWNNIHHLSPLINSPNAMNRRSYESYELLVIIIIKVRQWIVKLFISICTNGKNKYKWGGWGLLFLLRRVIIDECLLIGCTTFELLENFIGIQTTSVF